MHFFIEDKGYSVLSGDDGYICVHTTRKADLSDVIDDVVGNMRFFNSQDARLCAIMRSEGISEDSIIIMFDAFYHRKYKNITLKERNEIIGERL
jgi:hypothetical protein